MLFLGLIMMPFYYISKTHSVPGYLKLRFGEPARALSAITFGFMTVLMSGVNMYAMAIVLKVILGWDINFSVWVSSLTVAIYVVLGGLRSAIFNEVLQFFLIWLGAIVTSVVGLVEAGGWSGMVRRIHANFPRRSTRICGVVSVRFNTTPWASIGRVLCSASDGLFHSATGQRTFSWSSGFDRRDMRSAKMAPIIGAAFKICIPFIVILPGLLGLAVLPETGRSVAGRYREFAHLQRSPAAHAGPLLRTWITGLGITALIAGFMSGMAGNVSAFTTVLTYDIYRAFLKKHATDKHYVNMGRWCYGAGRSGEHRDGVPGDAVPQHHGLCAGAVQLFHRAAVRHGDFWACSGSGPQDRRVLGVADEARPRRSACGYG